MYRAEEDYLKVVYELTIERDKPLVKLNEVSYSLGFTDQSVNEMIKKLNKKGLVKFIPYKGVSLTKKGIEEAVRLIRAHRVWEVFLITKLNYDWKAVHKEAEKLEHASSDDLIEDLYQFLGRPNYCQHGNPIPDINGVMDEVYTMSLAESDNNVYFQVKRVLDNYELLNFLDEVRINLDDILLIENIDEVNGVVKIIDEGTLKHLPYLIAKQIFGEIVN